MSFRDCILRAFRRAPAHLCERTPAEGDAGQWPAPPDETGRAFLRSMPKPPLERAMDKAKAAVAERRDVAKVDPEEYYAALKFVFGQRRLMEPGEVHTLYGVRLELSP
ncbi:hypothetical protein Mx8p43 [Myxococcus phage Mx8]|uniref:p43 n=1 Tax=Myxococcus phage Mx8 TaxID=49964 RepID=Q94MS6_9CAUD|nr:hypothetical protein Mx8p43 [Myxococcus phage Mx8]AAK94378.1 p43 [Myxococcus phage Mx8]